MMLSKSQIPYGVLLALDLILIFYLQCSCVATILFLNLFYLGVLHREILRTRAKTWRRDLRGLETVIGIAINIRRCKRLQSTVPSIFREQVAKYGENKIAMIDLETSRRWTFRDVESFSNRVANYFQREGYRKGDVVALYMNNCIEYACFWLGLSKLGVITALINSNLKAEPLGHSITIGNAKAIIVGGDLQDGVAEAIKSGFVGTDMPTYVYKLQNENAPLSHVLTNGKNLKRELDSETVSKLSPSLDESEKPGFRDVLCYVYTSGTTGLPKAAIISHARFFMLAFGTKCSFRLKAEDRIYVTMPMYHSAAGIVGIGQVFLGGTSAVIRKKFSASRFWEECIEYDCTVSQYIGELCRYLVSQPPKPSDRQHKVRIIFGNGLRADLWNQFVDRFGVKEIGEFYGSTEGNTTAVNLDSHPGACGFLPISYFTQFFHPVALMKIDPSTGELARDARGLCVRCGPGETGEIMGKIVKGDPFHDFDGYVSGKDTNKKVVRNVYRQGDVAFSSGDVLYMDELGYLYFKDRTGDTFRWKGENVSTNEVESVVQRAVGMNDATVYGVEIPGTEGKAGMAAIVDENQNTDLNQLSTTLKEKLPPYARPVFLRLCKKVETTGTYKLVKHELQKAGYDLQKCHPGDKLYYLNIKNGQYEELTTNIYEAIKTKKMVF